MLLEVCGKFLEPKIKCLEPLAQDPFDQDDWAAYAEFNKKCGKDCRHCQARFLHLGCCTANPSSQDVQIVGDDLSSAETWGCGPCEF